MNSLSRRTEYFWLCDSRALNMKLVLETGAGVTLVSVQSGVGKGPSSQRAIGQQ
jgi:hypothetical protein